MILSSSAKSRKLLKLLKSKGIQKQCWGFFVSVTLLFCSVISGQVYADKKLRLTHTEGRLFSSKQPTSNLSAAEGRLL